jgi:hypothetical protein
MLSRKTKAVAQWCGLALAIASSISFSLSVATGQSNSAPTSSEIWRFDKLQNIGGIQTNVVGHPRLIDTPAGKAVEFNGVDDALFIEQHPLAGATAFSFEAIFRPQSGGAPEQRWFHLAERDPQTGADTDTRMLLEIRLTGNQWYLDAFVHTPTANQVLVDRAKLHPADNWYAVAMTYDGTTLKSFVNGELQGQADVHLTPQGPGHSSVGVRINRVNYFKGDVYEGRFTRRALGPDEILKLPAGLRAGQ